MSSDTPSDLPSSPEVVFTMGISGSGKSYILEQLGLLSSHEVINSDEWKKQHPDYDESDPDCLSRIHRWSSTMAKQQFIDALASGEGRYVYDTTGTWDNGRKLASDIQMAKDAGFYTKVIYVQVSLETSLARNASRPRSVDEAVVRQKGAEIGPAVETVMTVPDHFVIINND